MLYDGLISVLFLLHTLEIIWITKGKESIQETILYINMQANNFINMKVLKL